MNTSHPRAHVALDIALMAVFFATILTPPIVHVLHGGGGEATRMEYRRPKPFPDRFSLDFPREFQAYYNDNFALRTELVRWHNRVKLLWLGSSPNPVFVAGKDGWLFHAGEKAIENHIGALRLTGEDLERWRRVLEGRRNWMADRGIHYAFMVVPDKHDIYGEMLPDVYYRPSAGSLYRQWTDYFRRKSDFQPIEIRDALLAEKEKGLIYYRLGTHWNYVGAFVAYEECMRHLKRWFPDLEPIAKPRFFLDPTARNDSFGERMLIGDLMEQDIYGMDPDLPQRAELVSRTDEPLRVKVFETGDPSLPSAMIFHDSYGNWLEPFFADSFSRVTFVLKGALDLERIEREKPDVVIEEWGERRLWRVPR